MTGQDKALVGEGSVLGNRYRLDSARQDSPLAEVWLGHDLVLDRTVVIKVLHSEVAGSELIEQFRSQAISAARLSHPNIVPTFDAGTDAETAFMVSGYVEGIPLSAILEKGPLPLEITACIGVQVADALDHAHQVNLVHRDVRPSRLLVVDDEYRVMLTDFGVATAVADAIEKSLSAGEATSDDPDSLAPEQDNHHEGDARADILAIGRLLHTAGCGEDHPIPACQNLPTPMIEILAKATAGEAQTRYHDAASLRSDLDQYLAKLNQANEGNVVRRVRIPPPVAPRTPRRAVGSEDDTTASNFPPVAPSPGEPTAAHGVARSVQSNPQPKAQSTVAASHAEMVRAQGERRSRRRRVITTVVVVGTIVAAIALGRLVSEITDQPAVVQQPAPNRASTLTASSFDPAGDGRENESQVAQAVDNNPATAWPTERYNTRRFGNLKAGVGLIINQSDVETLKTLTIDSNGEGWAAQIYVSDSPKADLAAWGPPVDTQSGLGPAARFDLHSAKGSAVLLWITDLGSGNRLSVSEARIQG